MSFLSRCLRTHTHTHTRTAQAQFGLCVQQGLVDLLWLGDVHLEEGEVGGAALLQLSGSAS